MTDDEMEPVAVTNGSYDPDDMGEIGDAARRIASYCGGEYRRNVYRKAKQELTAITRPAPVDGLVGMIDALISAVVEEAEQTCRYLGKHNSDSDKGDYHDGFQTACDILGTSPVIAEHVQRHKDRILATALRAQSEEEVEREALREAARELSDRAFRQYRARNGKMCSIEGDDGEACWIIPWDAMDDLRQALERRAK